VVHQLGTLMWWMASSAIDGEGERARACAV
jgi:hypothetical protein